MSQQIKGAGWFRTLIVLLPLLCTGAFAADKPPEKSDVRVLIDISGSMRQNDPNNLRRPALRMLAGLLQPGTRAGVWTFARWVNNLVPVAEVDAAWKKRTQSLSKQISSPGQFTNIEDVLDRASRSWTGRPTTHARHLVLLTDGMVDVSKKTAENAQSRTRILEELLPRLKTAGVKVHTIALSARADHELMKRLAGETGGWYQQVDQADQLQRVFLKMFETVGKPDAIPLQGNRFTVDGSISEATVLVFSKPDSPPVVLRSPAGDEYTDSDLPAGVAWYRDEGYDLVTIDRPQKGEWSLQADTDPDNRVMIVTDLKLRTSEIPTHLAVGEPVQIEAYLSNSGKLVRRQAFLRLLEVRADAITADGTDPLSLNDQGKAGDSSAADGRYGMRYAEQQPRESVELLVSVDSPTFMREKRYRLAVHELATGVVEAGDEGPFLDLEVSSAVLQPGATVDVWQEGADGQRQPLAVNAAAEGKWQALLADAKLPVYATVAGTSRLGNPVARTIGPLLPPGVEVPAVDEVAPEVQPEPQAEAPAAPQATPEPQLAPERASEPEPEPVPAPGFDEDPGWVLPALVFGGFNLLLLLGGAGWWFLRRRRGSDEADDDLDIDGLVGEPSAAGDDTTDARGPGQEEAA